MEVAQLKVRTMRQSKLTVDSIKTSAPEQVSC